MTCEEARYKLQALMDNELVENEIPEAVNHMESCYRCREEYIGLLTLQKKLKGAAFPEPPGEWFEKAQKKIGRRITSSFGQVLFIGSYVLLLGYLIFSLLISREVPFGLRFLIGGFTGGILVLLGVTVADRVKENKTDKYKGVIK